MHVSMHSNTLLFCACLAWTLYFFWKSLCHFILMTAFRKIRFQVHSFWFFTWKVWAILDINIELYMYVSGLKHCSNLEIVTGFNRDNIFPQHFFLTLYSRLVQMVIPINSPFSWRCRTYWTLGQCMIHSTVPYHHHTFYLTTSRPSMKCS